MSKNKKLKQAEAMAPEFTNLAVQADPENGIVRLTFVAKTGELNFTFPPEIAANLARGLLISVDELAKAQPPEPADLLVLPDHVRKGKLVPSPFAKGEG